MDLESGIAGAFGFGNQFVNLIFWVFIICLIGAIIYFVIYIFSFNIKVIIKEKIGAPFKLGETQFATAAGKGIEAAKVGIDGEILRLKENTKGEKIAMIENLTAIATKTKTYNGRIIKKNGRYHLKLFTWFTAPIRLKVPDSLYVNLGLKEAKRIEFLKISQHFYAPIVTIYEKDIHEKAEFEDSFIDWLVQDIEDDKAKYKYESFWSKYGGMIAQIGIIVLMFLMLVVTFRYSQDLANTNAQAANAIANALESITNSCAQTIQ